MTTYRPPLREIEFALNEVIGLSEIAALPGFSDCPPELATGILAEAGRISAEVLDPLNRKGDIEGAKLENGKVRHPEGWAEAYKILAEGNWIGLTFPEEWGGMGLPALLGTAVNEMMISANMAFMLCPLVGQGGSDAVLHHASDEQREKFLRLLISGQWAATMDLTEPQAGSDLGAIKTKAVKTGDHYLLSGRKIFITYGEHELAENILHLVLARTPDAPPGIKGISLFLVPKFTQDNAGKWNRLNDMVCVSLEHKLGIKAAPTCVMAYGEKGGAVGWLVGEENRGLEYMFAMMNHARLDVGLQGAALSERAYQRALNFAHERIQGQAPGAKPGAPIIAHPDVRRMISTMRASTEAMRLLAYEAAALIDRSHHHADKTERDAALRRAEFLTPIVKGWCTELGVEITSLGVQIHGGMGYIEETGAAQHLRDIRIATIYEGTTAIQARDLVLRKILRENATTAREMLGDAEKLAGELEGMQAPLPQIGAALKDGVTQARRAVDWLLAETIKDVPLASAASVPFLLLMGTVLAGGQIAKGAKIAAAKRDGGERNFYQARINSALHYARHILPRANALVIEATEGARTVLTMAGEEA